MKARSILIRTPFIKHFHELFDIVNYWYHKDVDARLCVRLFIGERREIFSCSRIRLFGFTWAVWAWEVFPPQP